LAPDTSRHCRGAADGLWRSRQRAGCPGARHDDVDQHHRHQEQPSDHGDVHHGAYGDIHRSDVHHRDHRQGDGLATTRHPAGLYRIGFHESTLDGAQQLESLPTSAPTLVLEGRARDTTARGAADVMVDPDAEIRAPVTGTVRYAGTYVLYCKYSDDFLIIEPDDHPGWEVKMLHIDGVRVRPGARVQAGITVVAPRATRLPFASQVEEGSYRPAWPHVHIEVDDPNVPDRPTGPGC